MTENRTHRDIVRRQALEILRQQSCFSDLSQSRDGRTSNIWFPGTKNRD